MSGPQFWETSRGLRFFDGTLPRLTDTLKLLADELKRANDLKEEETRSLSKELARSTDLKEREIVLQEMRMGIVKHQGIDDMKKQKLPQSEMLPCGKMRTLKHCHDNTCHATGICPVYVHSTPPDRGPNGQDVESQQERFGG